MVQELRDLGKGLACLNLGCCGHSLLALLQDDKTLATKGTWQLRCSLLPQVRPLGYLYSALVL